MEINDVRVFSWFRYFLCDWFAGVQMIKYFLSMLLMLSPAMADEIVISNQKKTLTLYKNDVNIKTYRVAVGRPGAQWSSAYLVSRKAEWPSWSPTASQRKKKRLPVFMKGGPNNPLGARALYLGNSLYRIHGTNKPDSIGKAVSNGCIRMLNSDVIDLYSKVPVGTKVTAR